MDTKSIWKSIGLLSDGCEIVYFDETPGPGRLRLQVLSVRRAGGELKYLAGTESGMGVWINEIVPETAARRLRDAADPAERGEPGGLGR